MYDRCVHLCVRKRQMCLICLNCATIQITGQSAVLKLGEKCFAGKAAET